MLHFFKDKQSDFFAKLWTRLRKDTQRIPVSSLSVCPSLESGPEFSEVIRLCILRKLSVMSRFGENRMQHSGYNLEGRSFDWDSVEM
ncbi:hypothetical protein F2Q69_00028494 [Brassica cretica]|uniref:Uncharacterized protein n=1 Tax=Brassica cretica TaxID=69181 RepID=A0A8S9S3S2_BRACR|nr:hypothetical protein F2Q69_00028494 [Brassica cretica]